MAPLHRTAAFISWAWLLFSIFFSVFVQAQQPEKSITYFQNLPASLFFFDDTTSVIYHDVVEGNVYVSQDEGKSWNRAEDISNGDANMVVEHPFDNNYAFVLTRGTRHYRTDDRGKTWRPFNVPIPPAWMSKPLSFHSDPKKYGYILYQGTNCDRSGWGAVCHDETYYTKEAFGDEPKLLLSETSRCQFAHSSKDFKHDAHADLIYCVAFDTSTLTGSHSIASSRLFSSTDFFQSENKVEDLGIGAKNAKGVVAFAIVSKFAVVALKDMAPGSEGEMQLYVSIDTKSWSKAQFPHATSAKLRENAYTIVESTTHSLAVDVVLQNQGSVGTLFVSGSDGTYFVESLRDTNRNEMGYVDYETLYGVEGVGIANVVANAQDVEGRGAMKQLRSMITFDDGSTWSPIRPPSTDSEGRRIGCDPADATDCSLHLHSVSAPHNFGRIFSSPAPGFVMGVGSVGPYLNAYEDSDTFLSDDAGVTWRMVRRDAHKYEFGDQGSVLVVVNDEEEVDVVRYSTDLGRSWTSFPLGIKMRARALTTVPDSTSQKFILLGQIARKDQTGNNGRFAVVHLDFAHLRTRQCQESDFERWYARTASERECLMGHKQWYRRRRPDADCYVGNKFEDPVVHEDSCPCTDEDYECDYNYVRNGKECVPIGPEPIEAGVCSTGSSEETYLGSSGYRLIPGNTCDRESGIKKDEKVKKKCSEAQPPEGEITHQTFDFPASIVQQSYFKEGTTILVRLSDNTIWQSSNEGYIWNQPVPDQQFLAFYLHSYTPDRAYLITAGKSFYYTTDTGKTWLKLEAPTAPNTFGGQVLHFHPQVSDYLIWTGNEGCEGLGPNCHAVAHYSTDNGRKWQHIEDYVRNCGWARDAELKIDKTQILCESYRDKKGNQRFFGQFGNPLELVSGADFFRKKMKLFDHIVGFTKFSEYLIVAEYVQAKNSLELQVSLDGRTFASGMFPPTMRPTQHAYTILESSTDSVFLHVTTSEAPNPVWGNILKSNSNGTYFGVSVENVNRDDRGYVDFEKMIGLDGIALINVVSNPQDAPVAREKRLQTRITHNDGGTWKPLLPPKTDSLGNTYSCNTVSCGLNVHGYTERFDPRATYSTPSVPGLMMAVGNVGESLASYTESDTFMSRDGGFSWEEVHKDAHIWEFGDSGGILVMANDEEPTDHVLFSTDEGKTWREYQFSNEKLRVYLIVTVPSDTSRRFILFGSRARSTMSVAVHLDFSALTRRPCVLDTEDPNHDDFELWSPSEQREERCLFGRQTLFHRRRREANCVVGRQPKAEERIVKNCQCTQSDFECEFNYVRNEDGICVLTPDAEPLPDDPETPCRNGEDYWYERTPYRKIPHSSCEDGVRPDRGARHECPGFKAHGGFFWFTIILLPFAFTALVAWWWYRKSGMARGTIRLPGDMSYSVYKGDSGFMSTLASVPWFALGLAGIAWEWVSSHIGSLTSQFRSRRGYRSVPVDEDAQILRFEDEE